MTPNSVESLLQAMVGINTVNSAISGLPNAELAMAQYLEMQAQALGLTTQRLPMGGESFNLLISHRVNNNAPWLLFESHMDTVSIEGMTVDPFAAEIRAGRLYGRGACDTKGTGAAMFWALKKYLDTSSPANNVAILFTVDEEIGKSGVRGFVDRHLATLDWRPAGAIVGEPTGLQPVVAHNGVVRWQIHTKGVAAHSSNPANGRSAIKMMLKVIDVLESRYIPNLTASHPLTGKAQCSINIIRGGVQINIIPEHCEIEIDRRVVPGEDPHQILPAVEEILKGLRRSDNTLQMTQCVADIIDWPLDPAGSETFAATVQQVVADSGLPAELVGVGYGTDGSNLSRAGIPTVVLGPGDIAQAHTHDEWLNVEELQHGAILYRKLMETPLFS